MQVQWLLNSLEIVDETCKNTKTTQSKYIEFEDFPAKTLFFSHILN